MAEGNGDVVVELLRAGAEQQKKDDDDKLWWELAPDQKVSDLLLRLRITFPVSVFGFGESISRWRPFLHERTDGFLRPGTLGLA